MTSNIQVKFLLLVDSNILTDPKPPEENMLVPSFFLGRFFLPQAGEEINRPFRF